MPPRGIRAVTSKPAPTDPSCRLRQQRSNDQSVFSAGFFTMLQQTTLPRAASTEAHNALHALKRPKNLDEASNAYQDCFRHPQHHVQQRRQSFDTTHRLTARIARIIDALHHRLASHPEYYLTGHTTKDGKPLILVFVN